MTQPQRGSARTEVRDLRNIVDRLDVLMGSSTAAGSRATAQSALGQTLLALTERVDALEREAEELRTLVNHLTTIATWQAKVTATLVGEETAVDDGPREDVSRRAPEDGPHRQDGQASQRAASGPDVGDGGGTGDVQRPSPGRTLDEDIDDILGSGQAGTEEDAAPPPDFGI